MPRIPPTPQAYRERRRAGLLLRRFRTKHKLTLRGLGELAGMGHITVYDLERGRVQMTLERMEKLRKVFGEEFISALLKPTRKAKQAVAQ